MRSVMLVVFFSLLSGCVEPAPGPIMLEETQAEAAAPDAALVFLGEDCLQYHSYFAANEADFQSFLPDGFAIDASEAGTFDLRIEATQCAATADDNATTQLWIELPVLPPAALAIPDHGHLLPIEVYVSSEDLRSTLENGSVPFVVGCHCATTTIATGPVMVDEIVSHSLRGVYELRATFSPSSGPFADEHWARYIATDGTVVAVLLVSTHDAQNRGAGAVAFQYSGPGGAPPVHAGIIHAVTGLALEMRSASPGLQQNL